MKLFELEALSETVEVGDNFDFELGDLVIESQVVGFTVDGIIVESDRITRKLLEYSGALLEAKYQGREVPLNKPMQGDVAKRKVYVKNKKGNVIKVNFGDKNMRIKKSNPKRRKSFRARHRCDTAKDKTTARYWSCRAW
jgi:hypothetical protein